MFAAASRIGLDLDALRDMTPAGSVSKLTRAQAASLLNRLNAGTPHDYPRERKRDRRRPKGVYRLVADAQRGMIDFLRIELGWTPQRLQEWLSERHHRDGRTMDHYDSSADAGAVIGLLKWVLQRTRSGSGEGGEGRTSQAV